MNYLRLIIRRFASFLGLEYFATEIWFKYLGYKNSIRISFLKETIVLVKKRRRIIISKGVNNFGSIGIVVRDFDDFFSTVLSETAKDGIETIDFSVLKKHTFIKNNDEFFSHDIVEPQTVTDIYVEKAQLIEGAVVFDIGTYAGTQTVYFSRLVGDSGIVLAFEPDKMSFNSLCKNLELHHCENVKALNYGIYSFDGKAGFSADGSMGAAVSNQGEFQIMVKKLQTVCFENNISKIDFIKMDIEGSEMEVLKSSVELIEKFKPRFIIEPHFIEGILNDKEIIHFFDNINYKTEVLKQGSFDYQPLIYAYNFTS